MSTLNYYLRPSTKEGDQKCSLCLRIIHRRKVRQLTTAYKLNEEEWDQDCQCINYSDATRRSYLEVVEVAIKEQLYTLESIIDRLENQGMYSCDDIVDSYRSDTGDLKFFCKKLSAALTSSGQERTARAYQSATLRFLRFNGGRDIPLKLLNSSLVKDFERHLIQEGKSLNTISFYLRNLRAIYNKAVSEQCVSSQAENPFAGVFTGVNKTRKRALSLQELRQLNGLGLPGDTDKTPEIQLEPGLYRAWRLFFFCFHARGMSFVDMSYLKKENIRAGVLSYRRKKTGQRIELALTGKLMELIDSFSNEVSGSPYLFPIIQDLSRSPRKQYESALRIQNLRLKELSQMAKLYKPLSTHVSRHSWASIAKSENLPLWVISEGLGHSNEKTTYTYLASFDRSVLDKAGEQVTGVVSGKNGIVLSRQSDVVQECEEMSSSCDE
ncbi:MAG: site-specific integrase [Prevotella sp.]|jgi:integrase|nr:site-specific integrase [Prevotella sp.]